MSKLDDTNRPPRWIDWGRGPKLNGERRWYWLTIGPPRPRRALRLSWGRWFLLWRD